MVFSDRWWMLKALAANGLMECPACAAVASAAAETDVDWSYEGDTGPGRWERLDQSFAACGTGKRQSPIDLAPGAAMVPGRMDLSWRAFPLEVVNTGHTIQANAAPGSSMVLEGRRFELTQFHFHHPAEHTVGGSRHAMEVHFVHRAAEGDLGVVGAFLSEGAANSVVAALWEDLPAPGGRRTGTSLVDPAGLLPERRAYFRYEGSLTTPPCSEIVSWVVMMDPIAVSRSQIDAFGRIYPSNARPVQPLNTRPVRRFL